MSSAAGTLRASVEPQNRMFTAPTLSSRSTPRLSSARDSSRLSRSPAPRVIISASTVATPSLPGGSNARAGRHEEVDRRRPDVIHPFGEQHQAVGKGVLVNLLSHGFVLFENPCHHGGPQVPRTRSACRLRILRTDVSQPNPDGVRVRQLDRAVERLVRAEPDAAGTCRTAGSLFAVTSRNARGTPTDANPASACSNSARPEPQPAILRHHAEVLDAAVAVVVEQPLNGADARRPAPRRATSPAGRSGAVADRGHQVVAAGARAEAGKDERSPSCWWKLWYLTSACIAGAIRRPTRATGTRPAVRPAARGAQAPVPSGAA